MDNAVTIDDLTICIPVRERQLNIPIIVEYYKRLNCKKIIFDSSRSRYDKEEEVKAAGFEYVYWGPTTYFKKWQKILKLVDTKYVMDCPDDDISLISSLEMCIDFLNKNEDYSSCMGIELGFSNFGIYPTVSSHACIDQIFYDFKSDDAYNRIEHFMTINPVSAWHSVLRTKVLKDYWNMINSEKDIQYLGYLESMHLVHVATAGNIKVLSIIFRMRNYRNDKHASRVHKKKGAAPAELSLFRKLIDNINFQHFLPAITEIRKNDSRKSPEECFQFLEDIFTRNIKCTSARARIWPSKSTWGKGASIPKFAPKEYQFKEIVNQADDIVDFEKAWHPGRSRINNELYSLVEENSPPKNSSNSKKAGSAPANGARQDK
jgi:glycosyltransferase domain-containing protein